MTYLFLTFFTILLCHGCSRILLGCVSTAEVVIAFVSIPMPTPQQYSFYRILNDGQNRILATGFHQGTSVYCTRKKIHCSLGGPKSNDVQEQNIPSIVYIPEVHSYKNESLTAPLHHQALPHASQATQRATIHKITFLHKGAAASDVENVVNKIPQKKNPKESDRLSLHQPRRSLMHKSPMQRTNYRSTCTGLVCQTQLIPMHRPWQKPKTHPSRA